ncbi:NAD(P)/FAD-dependent oxidoreductase [Phnomibacter ginsenosidimutans]|uniref:FAD-dependent oxidoreductase n=1 Tax=Phnomibacter ginsenosidimutans TaxID=2676868 RepID=A0A6I6G5F5_9BACT|nr:FAD-dependent oxidoreductase [Phnomibacter ginsenosidimutans]QGW27244.1 FAD-dependent oxidoreductase [Phnomibacter ginsenosidimutans]
MQTSVLIVGQGLCGTWLSFWLQQMGIDCIVIDEERPNTSTRVASGVINPVTGRRMTRTWMADEVIPFAAKAYEELGRVLRTKYEGRGTNEGRGQGQEQEQGRGQEGSLNKNDVFPANHQPATIQLIQRCDIIDFFNSPDRRKDFEEKAKQYAAEYLQWPQDEAAMQQHFRYELGYGFIAPAYQVDLQTMLDGWRQYLLQQQQLLAQRFDASQLQLLPNGVQYQDIRADKIVFADGIAAHAAGFFQLLPFALNKGEALILQIEGLPNNHIYKKGNSLTPWRGGYFWAGSTYNNHYTNDQPSEAFRQQMEAWLQSVLKHPFSVLDHVAAIRPATVERRPFAGWHPQHPQVGILNGTGTKGVTLAPYFAQQLAANIAQQTSLLPVVDVARFARVLSRS